MDAPESSGDVTIVDPWDGRVGSASRGGALLELLHVGYGGGHSISDFYGRDEVVSRIERGVLLIWLAYQGAIPIAVAAAEVEGDRAYLFGSIVMSGSRPGIGQQVMFRRLDDLLVGRGTARGIAVLEGDVRLSGPMEGLPHGGARAQHIARKSGLLPMLVCTPRYANRESGELIQQFSFRSFREVAQGAGKNLQLYTPAQHPAGGVTVRDIAKVCLGGAGWSVSFAAESYDEMPFRWRTIEKASSHYVTILAEGLPGELALRRAMDEALACARYVEVVVPNDRASIGLQDRLWRNGMVSLGALPPLASPIDGHNGSLHFGLVRPKIFGNLVFELADEYARSELAALTGRLAAEWSLLVSPFVRGGTARLG